MNVRSICSRDSVIIRSTVGVEIDAGPGMEVPGDPPSQGRELVNVSGHAIPAVLHGNQYAVLHDTEPTKLEDLDG